MEESEWTQEMDQHLLQLLTEMPSTPAAFPEVLNRYKQTVAEKNYYQTMQASFLDNLNKKVDVPVSANVRPSFSTR